jgi:cyclic pyranopterin phosphate synthase
MPEEEYVWLPREDLLTYAEISALVGIFTELGVDKVRLTGGEPLLRRNLATLVRMLAHNRRIKDLALTTNGVLLGEHAKALYDAGLHQVTVSLDTLRAERFEVLATAGGHDKVLKGIEAVRRAGFKGLKIDAVIMRGANEDELADLLEYGMHIGAEVRFIEYMDVGGATQWSMDKVFSRAEILSVVNKRYGRVEPVIDVRTAPADRFMLPDGTVFGIIGSTTAPFCRTCDRSRLTVDGILYLCLYAQNGINLRTLLRGGASEEEIKTIIVSAWQKRRDRGAEKRKGLSFRGVLVPVDVLRKNPHLEMHTRGG